MRPFNTFLLYVRTVPFDRLPKHPRITPCPQTRPIYGAMCEGKARLYPICVSRFVRMVLKSTKGASGCSIPSQPPSMSFQCGPRGMSSGTTDLIVLFMFGVVCVWGWVRGKGKGQAKAFSVHPFTTQKDNHRYVDTNAAYSLSQDSREYMTRGHHGYVRHCSGLRVTGIVCT